MLSQHADTPDENRVASTRLRQTDLAAGSDNVWAFILELLSHAERPLVPAARRIVLVSVDG